MTEPAAGRRRRAVWGAVTLLAILHWDFWLWDDRTLLFGFLPVGLGYHVSYSIAACSMWMLAVRFAWPSHVEEWAEEGGAAGGDR